MKAYFIYTVTGPKLFLTACDYVQHPECLQNLAEIGITKFVAFEVPMDLVQARYGERVEVVLKDPNQTDTLRMLDDSGERILQNFSFRELGPVVFYEPSEAAAKA